MVSISINEQQVPGEDGRTVVEEVNKTAIAHGGTVLIEGTILVLVGKEDAISKFAKEFL